VIYLTWYLAIGIAVLLVVFISHRLSTKSELSLIREILDGIQSKNKTRGDRLIDIVMFPLTAILAIVAWPIAVYFKAQGIRSSHKRKADEEAKKFSIARVNLMRQMAVEEIEQREHVTDPLGAVPDLPFGYLNAAWSQFKSNLEPQDSVWSFAAQWTTHLGCREIREGYVVVRGDNIGPHFLKSLLMIRYEVNDEQDSGLENPDNVLPPFLRPKKR
jgi:hypothetical protein